MTIEKLLERYAGFKDKLLPKYSGPWDGSPIEGPDYLRFVTANDGTVYDMNSTRFSYDSATGTITVDFDAYPNYYGSTYTVRNLNNTEATLINY